MLDGVQGRDSGILILRDGVLIGGGPYFWSVGSYTVGEGTWKGQLSTNQHTPFADPFVRPLFAGQEVSSGFSGSFAGDRAEVFGTTLVGNRSMTFRATLKKLADCLMRPGPSGPCGLLVVLKQGPEQLRQFALVLAGLIEESGNVDLVNVGAVTGPAHVTARLLMLDKQAVGVGVERQPPAILVGTFVALV
jgi:hypothetical protein